MSDRGVPAPTLNLWLRRANYHSESPDELWRHVPDFPGYLVSNYGQIYSWRYDGLMEPGGDYLSTSFRRDGKTYPVSVHRLVARVFLREPHDLEEVNHIDGDHRNNHVSNLEWVTPEENKRHRREVLRRPERWREEVQLMRDGRTRQKQEELERLESDRTQPKLVAEVRNPVGRPRKLPLQPLKPRLGRLPNGEIGVIWTAE